MANRKARRMGNDEQHRANRARVAARVRLHTGLGEVASHEVAEVVLVAGVDIHVAAREWRARGFRGAIEHAVGGVA